MNNFDYLKNQLDRLAAEHMLRNPVVITSAQSTSVKAAAPESVQSDAGGTEKILFCSNNYLNLANHPHIIESVCRTVKKYGTGSVASRLVTGTMTCHREIEDRFARYMNKPSALFFTSGWGANESVIKTIPQKGDLLLLDRTDHASIIDAALSGPARLKTYNHGDISSLERHLKNQKYRRKFIVTESIFSMDGDKADLAEIVRLKNKYNAIVIVDQAHCFGCLGPEGRGLAAAEGLLDEIDILVIPLGKAVASGGAVVCAPKVVTDYLINRARPFIYTTAACPATCAAGIGALEIIESEPERREKLIQNSEYMLKRLKSLGLNTAQSASHIIPVILGSPEKAIRVSARLYEKGFLVTAIRPPTVPKNTARLRISLQCEHTAEQIDRLCDTLAGILKENNINI